MSIDFKGKKALVIGGTSSVGLKVAQMLLSKNAELTVTGRKFNQSLYNAIYSPVKFIECDFEKDFDSCFLNESLNESLKETDILCVCYGPFVQKSLALTSSADWKKMALNNYALPGILLSQVLPGMEKRNFGRIIFFGGTKTESVKAFKTNAAYAGAKTGLSVIVKSTSLEYQSSNITCNAVCPGFTRNAPKETFCVSPADLAQKVYFLISSPELNGVILNVDRGW